MKLHLQFEKWKVISLAGHVKHGWLICITNTKDSLLQLEICFVNNINFVALINYIIFIINRYEDNDTRCNNMEHILISSNYIKYD